MVLLRIAYLVLWVVIAWSMGQAPPSGTNEFGKVVAYSFFLAAPLVYLLPTYEAWRRQHRSLLAIALVNVFLGWSIIGWVAAIVWACAGSPRVGGGSGRFFRS
ncbi:superinfection immunity protein [Variovorax sp. LARHSF232]